MAGDRQTSLAAASYCYPAVARIAESLLGAD